MKYLRLIVMMTRYRAAMVLVIFLLLGIFLQPHVLDAVPVWHICIAAIVLVLVYINAASVNDIADYEIDIINVKHHTDRPLMSGAYSKHDVVVLAVLSAVAALLVSIALTDVWVTVIVVGALLINTMYSLPPFKISHRAWMTPFFLPFAYVVVPFMMAAAMNDFQSVSVWFLLSFYWLFVARISLKDFRDRKGDRANGKNTLLLKYGKLFVCALSTIALTLGVVLLLVAIKGNVALQVLSVLLYGCIVAVEYRLFRAEQLSSELRAIAQAARLGNALLLALLGSFLLDAQAAPTDVYIVFYVLILGIYGYMTWIFLLPSKDVTLKA